MENPQAQIAALHEAWISAERAGRTSELAALCCEQIVIAPPGARPIVGLEAARAFLAHSAAPIAELRITQLEIAVFGALATKRARFATRIEGESLFVRGWHLWVLQPAWRIAYITWSIED